MPKRNRARERRKAEAYSPPVHNNPPTPEWLLERRRQDLRAALARTHKPDTSDE